MRKTASLAVAIAVMGMIAGCSKSAPAASSGITPGSKGVYFGYLIGTPTIGGVAVDLAAPDGQGTQAMRAYICDGLGPPEGMALWFTGTINKNATGDQTFTSAGGADKLVITAITSSGVYGNFTSAKGENAQVVAPPAFDGAGIYEVSLDQSLHYKGTSTDNAALDAQASADGTTKGTITTAGGTKIPFTVHSLALASPAALAAAGLRDVYSKYAATNQVPGEYVAVIAPGGAHWFGRAGNVRAGTPQVEIIGLDKKSRR